MASKVLFNFKRQSANLRSTVELCGVGEEIGKRSTFTSKNVNHSVFQLFYLHWHFFQFLIEIKNAEVFPQFTSPRKKISFEEIKIFMNVPQIYLC